MTTSVGTSTRGRTGGNIARVLRRVAERLTANIATLFIISILVFGVMSFKSPEDIARSVLGREVAQDQLEAFVDRHGLDAPFMTRYITWVGAVGQGDFGRSLITDRPVSKEISQRLSRSLTLALSGAVSGVFLGILAGVFLAGRVGTRTDLNTTTLILVVAALPEFLLGMLMYLLFVVWLKWFPTQSGLAFSFGTAWDRFWVYMLPAMTVAILAIPHVARVTRTNMAEALASPYVDAARLRGLGRARVVWGHALRNAAVPVASVIGLKLIYAVSGLVAIEAVFGFPGIGSLLVQTIGSGDIYISQAIIMIFALIVVFINICVDVVTLWLSPRLRFKS